MVLVILGCSLLALALAPLLLPASYSWIDHTTSESGAQGVEGAWLARAGFVLFGVAVLGLVGTARDRLGRPGSLLLGLFGVAMFMIAVFSNRPWEAGVPFDATEDLLHSIGASTIGVAFAAGVVAVAIHQRRIDQRAPLATHVVAVAAATILPLGMLAFPNADGLLQRLMFAVAYAWFARLAIAQLEARG